MKWDSGDILLLAKIKKNPVSIHSPTQTKIILNILTKKKGRNQIRNKNATGWLTLLLFDTSAAH